MGQWTRRKDTKPPIWDFIDRSGAVLASRNTEPEPTTTHWTSCSLCGQNTYGRGPHKNATECFNTMGTEIIIVKDMLEDATTLLKESGKQVGLAVCSACEWFVVSSKKNAQSCGEQHSRQTGHALEMLAFGLRWKIQTRKDDLMR